MSVLFRLIFVISACLLVLQSSLDASEYIVGPGDKLKLQVYPDDDFDVELHVDKNGDVNVPLIGKVAANDKPISKLARDIQDRLTGDFYRSPLVELKVLEYDAHRAYVLGAVKNPGAQPLHRGDLILDLIQRSGGLAGPSVGYAYVFARPESTNDEPEVQRVSLQRILQNADFAENIPIKNNDTVYLFEDERVFVMGAVKNPGSYQIASGNSLLKAITVAGGFTARANEKKVTIYRGAPLQGIAVNTVDLIEENQTDPTLQPGDLVFVPQRFF